MDEIIVANNQKEEENKPFTLRLNRNTKERFEAKLQQTGGSTKSEQIEIILNRIDEIDFQESNTEYGEIIGTFKEHMKRAEQLFMGSIQDMTLLRDTIPGEFKAQLDSKDATIMDLQAQKADLTNRVSIADDMVVKAKEERDNALKAHTDTSYELEQLRQMISAKTELIERLQTDIKRAEEKSHLYDDLIKEVTPLKEELSALKIKQAEEKAKLQEDFRTETKALLTEISSLKDEVMRLKQKQK